MNKPFWLRLVGWLILVLVLVQVANGTAFVILPRSRALLGGIVATGLLGCALLAVWILGSVTVYAARQRAAASALTVDALRGNQAGAPGVARGTAAARGARGPGVMTSPLGLSMPPPAPPPPAAAPGAQSCLCDQCGALVAPFHCCRHETMLCWSCLQRHDAPECAYIMGWRVSDFRERQARRFGKAGG